MCGRVADGSLARKPCERRREDARAGRDGGLAEWGDAGGGDECGAFFHLFERHTWVADAHTQRVLKDVVNGKPVEAPAKAVDELASMKPAALEAENLEKPVLETAEVPAEVRGASRAMRR